jgi:hypothetical protein
MAPYKSSPRGIRPVSLIAIHSAEGARTARSLGAYFSQSDVEASSHVGIDAVETLQYVPYDRAAWTLRSGNPISDNAELCVFSRWVRAQWLSTGTVDGCVNPRAILSRAAVWARSRAIARGIPLQHLTPVQVGQGLWGLIAHRDWTIGMRDGTHIDVGTEFPWDVFLAEVLADVPDRLAVPSPTLFQTLKGEEMIYYVKGNSRQQFDHNGQKMKFGDLVFLVEANADGMKRRHIQADELAAAEASGAKVTERSQEWVDGIPIPAGIFPWEKKAAEVPAQP